MDKVIEQQMMDLVKQLNRACDVYYNTGTELMSDAQYDTMYDELVELEKITGVKLPNSPTKRIGFEVKSALTKVEHLIPLKSLDKINNDMDKLSSWIGSKECYATLKLDGLTTELDYVDGLLVEGSTRGNGYIGEDITHSVKYYKNVPLKLTEPITVKVTGESVIKYGSFNHINSKLADEDKYKNPRNLVSGTIRSLNSEITARRDVRFFSFDCIDSDLGCTTQEQKLHKLTKLGFDIAIGSTVTSGDINMVSHTLRSLAKIKGFPIDGLVCTVNDLATRNSMGETEKFPKHSIAYKFKDESEETTLRDIEWTIGKSGALTPVAIFDPVELDGTTVTRASVHNVSILKNLKLGEGDTVTVKKANQIIPQIEENLTGSDTISIPSHCPYCNYPTKLHQDNESQILKCENKPSECKGQLVKILAHYVSREGMNINGLSEETLKSFIAHGIVENKSDIHLIPTDTDKQRQIARLSGFTEKGVKKLCDSIKKASKDVKLENFIVSLGIDGVGKRLSKDLSKKFKNVSNFLNAEVEGILEMDGVSTITANKIINSLNENLIINRALADCLEFATVEEIEVGDKFKDINFVVTGSIEKFKNRKELTNYIESNGGKLGGSVNKNTNYLICNSGSSSTKAKKAIELGVKVITEEELLNL